MCSHSMCCWSIRSQQQNCCYQTTSRSRHPSEGPRKFNIHYYWTYPYWTVKYPQLSEKKEKENRIKRTLFNVNRVLYKFNRVSGRVKISTTDVLGYHHMYQVHSSLLRQLNSIFPEFVPRDFFLFYKHESNKRSTAPWGRYTLWWQHSRHESWFSWQWWIRLWSLQLWHHVVWQVIIRVHQNLCNHLPLTA